MPRVVWLFAGIVAAGIANPVFAQPLGPLEPLPPVGGPSLPPESPPLPPAANTPARDPSRPPAILGAPVSVSERAQPVTPITLREETPKPQEQPPQRAAAFGAPSAGPSYGAPASVNPATPVPATVVDSAIKRTAFNPPEADPVNDFLTKRSDPKAREKTPDRSPRFDFSSRKIGDMFDGVFGDRNGEWFRSDHMFDGFISPLSNPFLAEDPRSLTELRPIFMIQKIPTAQPDFRGGNITFFGTQARVAITDRWSVVFNKIGGISVNPGSASAFRDETGFAEIWLGPKYTFYRGEENGALVAGGLQFQLPAGSRATFQNTGSLSLVPYVTYGQNFLRDFRLGSFNSIISTGYSFSTNDRRSDYYWLSAHLDFDVGNLHRFYPLAELNWFLYTSGGKATPIGIEGRDLINFGGQSKSALLTGTLGGRVKITESAQIGAGFEIPLAGRKDLFRYRFTVDFILRY